MLPKMEEKTIKLQLNSSMHQGKELKNAKSSKSKPHSNSFAFKTSLSNVVQQ